MEESETVPVRLALRREPDKSFNLLGAIAADSRGEITVTTPKGGLETYPRKGLTFVTLGSLNYFARLDPESLQKAFDDAPRRVFEQALVDAPAPLSTADLKEKLTHAGLARADVDRAWGDEKKALGTSSDVKITGEGSSKKFAWRGLAETRLGQYVALPDAVTRSGAATKGMSPDPHVQESGGSPPSDQSEVVGTPVPHLSSDVPATSRSASEGDNQDEAGSDDLLLTTLSKLLGASAPRSLDEISHSLLRIGAELSTAPTKELKTLADVDETQRPLVTLLLLARDREMRLWSKEPQSLEPGTATEAIGAAIGESSRSAQDNGLLARFAGRVLRRTELSGVPLTLVASAFVRAAGEETESEPSKSFLDLAGALADRAQTSVSEEWDRADPLVRDIARGMSGIPLDEGGPRSRFIAALYVVRRHHLNSDLFWRNTDLDALDLAAGGVLRRTLLDPALADRVIRPEVARFISECSSRHGIGRLIALRGSFAQYVDARAIAVVMNRVAMEDPKAREWFMELRQQDRLDVLASERDAAVRDAATARGIAEEADLRLAKALSDRETALRALNRASQTNAKASDAQLRQAKIDVLRSLAGLAVTIGASAAAQDDPALLQRLAFALRREGLTEIAAPGETVAYDPVLHDAQGEHIDAGASVAVGRSGYSIDSGDEPLVLIKAHVSVI